MNMSNDYQLLLFSGLAILMWGLWGFFGKLALEKEMAPTTIFFAEVFVGLICAIPVLLVILSQKTSFLMNFSWNIFGLVSGAGLASGLLFFYLALEKGQVHIVVPLTASYPIISVLLSYIILNERPSYCQWIGIILVVAGAVLLLSGPLSAISNTEDSISSDASQRSLGRPAHLGGGDQN